MYLAISALGMTFTAIMSDYLGAKTLSYGALFLGAVTSISLCVLTMIGISQGFFNPF